MYRFKYTGKNIGKNKKEIDNMHKIKITAIMCILLWTSFFAKQSVSLNTDTGSIRQAFEADVNIETRDYHVDIVAYDEGTKGSEGSYLHYILHSENEEEAIKEEMKTRHKKYDIYRTLTGAVHGKISEKEQKEYTEKINKRLGAVTLKKYIENDTYIYGYSDKLGRTVKSRGKKINCQIIFSYNEAENVTEITVGSPVVFST